MKKSVHHQIRDIILNLDIDAFIEHWLRICKEIHLNYCGLFTAQERFKHFKENESFIGIPFQEGAISTSL